MHIFDTLFRWSLCEKISFDYIQNMHTLISSFPWKSLLAWYEKHGRHDLEWRDYSMDDESRAYRIWLSEIFLQQTQVERVRGYFLRILEKYPTVHHLARASYEEFFPYYQGMGYYSRARNLLATAHIISTEYHGIFPREKSLLEKLPGVWWYTSSAILAFAYGEAYLAWDTNLEKVFARYHKWSRLDKLSVIEKLAVEDDFQKFVKKNREKVRAINNALMDFASTIDVKNPSNIGWSNYPIQSGIFYETRGVLEPVEVKKSLSFPTPDAQVVVILHKDHKVYYSAPAGVISTESVILTTGEILTEPDISFLDITGASNSPIGYWIPSIDYNPFILPPALTRDTRKYVQAYFREKYGLELSVRPAHKKWISEDGKAYIAVNAQIQVWVADFTIFEKK